MSVVRCRGFTLLELVTVLLVTTVLLTAGIPSLRQLLVKEQLVSLHSSLRGALYLARSHAIQKGIPTSVCPVDAGGACAVPSGDWTLGWMVFEDADLSGRCVPGGAGHCQGGRRILRTYPPLPKGFQVRANQNVSKRVRYSALGMSYGHNGRFTLCGDGASSRSVGLVVSSTGRVRQAGKQDLLACP